MRTGVFAHLAVSLSLCVAATAKERFPYVVHVANESALIRSGPGKEYYETATAARGMAIEVWREAPGGWLAVRPLKESFSVVPAADVRLAPNRLAEVIRPELPARIGSHITPDHDVVQVFLEQGERVRVLETISLQGQFWHRIAPPAGEFRWIHSSAVSGPAMPARPQVAETFLPVQSEPTSYRIAAYSTAAEASHGPPQAADPFSNGRQTLADVVPSAGGRSVVNTPVTLADIEVELATIVAEDSRFWDFAHLRRRCLDVMSASDAARQQSCEAILDKIARFEQIREKKVAIAGGVAPVEGATADVSTTSTLPPIEASIQPAAGEGVSSPTDTVTWRAARGDTNREVESSPIEVGKVDGAGDVVRIPDRSAATVENPDRYDGVGTLKAAVSRRADVPRYVLVDAEGEVVSFITPNTGVNLQPYIGQRIGVVGTRGYMPEFKRPHVTAARVTPLR